MSREKAPPATNQKQRGRTHKNTEATRKLAKLRSVNKKTKQHQWQKENPHCLKKRKTHTKTKHRASPTSEDKLLKLGGHRKKNSEDTGKKKNRGKDNAVQEDTEAWKCITPSEWRMKNQGTICRSRPLGYATYGYSCGCGKHSRWKVHRRPLRLGGKQKAEIKTPSTCSGGRHW